ncbi:TPA: hypothetical protein UMT89_000831 [Stenotrophomonas maltophilia]|jgi:hypothetical protein|uniref:hypothetical protein n=1 Tax=Stenotrophomonas sp. SMYL86 TaxID=3076044 RepID=UPI002A9CF8D7|nr:hypothetical protein [Stenotrophomonas sp. SMYL86]HEL3809505.1 hypothetical protein [Stenotrophomonas maltophilia]
MARTEHEVDAVPRVPPQRGIDWPNLVIVFTFAITVCGVFTYWIGASARNGYLAELGIPNDGFSLAREGLLGFGADALVQMASDYPHLLEEQWGIFAFLSLAIGGLTTYFLWPMSQPETRAKRSPRRKAVSLGVATALILPMMGLIMSMFAIVLIAVPAGFGNHAGKVWAAEIRRDVCTPAAKAPCVELWDEDKKLGCGAVIAESTTRLAFLDERTGQTRVMDVQGLQSIGVLAPDRAKRDQRLCTDHDSPIAATMTL